MEYKILITDESEIELINKLISVTKCKEGDITTVFRQLLESFGPIYLDWWINKGWYITTNTPTSPHVEEVSKLPLSNKDKVNTRPNNFNNSVSIGSNHYSTGSNLEEIYNSEEDKNNYDEETPLEDLI